MGETQEQGQAGTEPATVGLEERIDRAVAEGFAVALSDEVWTDVASQVRAEYRGEGMEPVRAAIRRAVRRHMNGTA